MDASRVILAILSAGRRTVAVVCFGLLFGGVGEASAQSSPNYVQDHWTTEDGLPVNAIVDMEQGPAGYLWFATYDGLVRFDGVSFSTMTKTGTALPTDQFRQLWIGPNGHLWIRTSNNQLVEVDPQRRAVVQTYGRGKGGISEQVVALTTTENQIWIGTMEGVYRRNTAEETWGRVLDESVRVYVLRSDSSGAVWVGTEKKGLWRVTSDSARQIAARTPEGDALRVLKAIAIGPSTVWVGDRHGAFRVEEGELKPLRAAGASRVKGRAVLHLDVTSDTTAWLLTREGQLFGTPDDSLRHVGNGSVVGRRHVVRRDVDGHRWIILDNQILRKGRPILTANRGIHRVLQDHAGNLWVGTSGDGLYRLRRTPVSMIDGDDGLPSENVYGIARSRSDPQSLYVGSIHGGLIRLRNGNAKPLTEAWGLPKIVWTAHEDRSGRFWMGTEEGLYYRQSGTAAQSGLPPSLRTERVRAVYEDRFRRLWVLASGELYRRTDERWHRDTRNIPSGANGSVMTQTKNGSVWIGTNSHGLLRVRDGRVDHLTEAEGLATASVLSLYEAPSGHLWVGTTGGINRIDRKGTPSLSDDSVATVRMEHGLPDNLVVQILPDNQGRLWISTHRGIYRVKRAALNAVAEGRRDQLAPVTYTERDGLKSREANGGVQSAGTRTPDGRLWFPTQAGVAVIEPGRTRSVPPPPAAIEAVSPAGNPRTDTTYAVAASGDTLHLSPSERTFTIQYTGLHLSNPEATRFRVQLRGVDQRPLRADQRQIRYAEVGPGTYTLRVQAAGERRSWGTPARLTLHVAPFWWETWGFYVLCGLGLLGLVGAGYRWRTRQLRRRQEELEKRVAEQTEEVREQRNKLEDQAERLKELDEAKSRFFANLSHEFRTPLTLIRGPVQQVRRHLERGQLEPVDDEVTVDGEQLSIVERNIDRLQRLVDQLLGLARLEAGTYELTVSPTDIGAAVPQLVREFEPLAERAGLSLTVDPPGERPAPNREPVYVDREALERIVSNLLSNAIKYTPDGGDVAVTVRDRGEAVEVQVCDTGVGIPEEAQDAVFDRFARADAASTGKRRDQEGIGIGLALTKDLVELHGGTIGLESTEGEGTTVTARFPRGCEHLPDDHLASDEVADDLSSQSPTPDADDRVPNAERPTRGTEPSTLDAQPPDETMSDNPGGSSDGHSQISNPQSKIVLVVDDNADVRRYVRSVLTPDFAVIEAANGEEGLTQAREHLPDVILADVMMPEVDGHEMTRRLKEDPETEAIPVIMVTARAETQDEVAGLQIGADDYVTKPFDADVLRQRVGGVLTLQQRLRRRLEAALDGDGGAPEEPKEEERSQVERRARAAVQEHLTNPDFGVSDLADALAMSRSTLYRKLKAEADVTPSTLLRQVRVDEAAELLQEGKPVTQVAYAVGYESLSAFTSAFKSEHDMAPTAYAAEHGATG